MAGTFTPDFGCGFIPDLSIVSIEREALNAAQTQSAFAQILISIGAGQAVYDTAVYDTDVYAGSGRRIFYTNLPLGAEGRVYVQQATYTGQEAFKWFSYAPGLVPEVTSRDFSE